MTMRVDARPELGYEVVDFSIGLADRRRAAELGNRIIDIASENEPVLEALTFDPVNLAARDDVANTTSFAIRGPRVSADNSVWFHSGWQSYERARSVLPTRNQPEELCEFFDVQREILTAVAKSWMAFFRELKGGAADFENGVNSIIFESRMTDLNNHHLRIVRYRDLSSYSQDNPTFSAHGDLGVVTGHLFETHHGHLRVAPYPLEHVKNEVTPERIEHARSLHKIAQQVSYNPDGEAVVFLGFGAAYLTDPDGSWAFEGCNAGYHFGEPPEKNAAIDDAIASDFGDDVRVTMVAFGHPHVRTPYTRYRTTTKEACRPEQLAHTIGL